MNGVDWNNARAGLVALCVLFVGCAPQENSEPEVATNPQSSTVTTRTNLAEDTRQVFQVRGVVKELKLDEKKVSITHEEIPDYMPAMTMPFEVRDTNELAGISSGDQVKFTMIVTEKDGWIENIEKIGVADPSSLPQPAKRPEFRLVREVEPLEEGDPMPNYVFTNSLGKKVELADYQGQAYAFTFIFTRCPFPTFCPRMNSNFEEAYKHLATMPNAPTNWHLFTISFDTEFDTPEQLRRYSARYQPDPTKWDFLTGALIDIDAISEQVGLGFAYRDGTFDHNLRTVVVDAAGKVQKIFWGNEWTGQDLAQELLQAAKVEPAEPQPAKSSAAE